MKDIRKSWYPRKKLGEIVGVVKRFYGTWDESAYRKYLEAFGLDESWVDLSGPGVTIADGERTAQEIRRRVREELGITVSIGVADNKVFAKLGSDMKKPDAVTVLPPHRSKGRPRPFCRAAYSAWADRSSGSRMLRVSSGSGVTCQPRLSRYATRAALSAACTGSVPPLSR